ncbi:MAG: OB-fold nucleic acid binding domain-containing protein, partial [Chloroflexota bacterium]|nr:OB-fold nucleic acid binding domain-containing protein [Chloroflexota bacterium]
MLKTHTCGELHAGHAGQRVTLAGWLHRRRDHGGLIFIDLRDRFGMTQVTVGDEAAAAAHETAYQVRNEYVLQVRGVVQLRPAGFENLSLSTGKIEVIVDDIVILNPSKTPPFYISDAADDVDESLRLKYRY